MSLKVETSVFVEMSGEGHICFEVDTERRPANTLAYVTLIPGERPTYSISVFGIGWTYSRRITRKTLAGAQSVLDKHLESEGYETVAISHQIESEDA